MENFKQVDFYSGEIPVDPKFYQELILLYLQMGYSVIICPEIDRLPWHNFLSNRSK